MKFSFGVVVFIFVVFALSLSDGRGFRLKLWGRPKPQIPKAPKPKPPKAPKSPKTPTGPANQPSLHDLSPEPLLPRNINSPPVQKSYVKDFFINLGQGIKKAPGKSYNALKDAANKSIYKIKKAGGKIHGPNRSKYERLDKIAELDEGLIPSPEGGPKKKSQIAKTRSAVLSALQGAASALPAVTNTAANAAGVALSMQQLEWFKKSEAQHGQATSTGSADPGLAEGQETEVSGALSESCPAPPTDIYVSEQKQKCTRKATSSTSSDDVEIIEAHYSSRHSDSEYEDSNEERQVKTLTFGNSLKLELTDYVTVLKDRQKKNKVCRRKVLALSDTRIGYIQTLEIKGISDASVSSIESHRQITLTCAAKHVPLVSLLPGTPRSSIPKRQVIPQVTENSVTKLEWRAINWYTMISNSCHLDSFMTYFLFTIRRSEDYLTRNLLSVKDGAQNVLKQIAGNYMGFLHDKPKSSIAEQKIHDNKLKELWINVFYPEFDLKKKKIDFRGHETESIAEKLDMSLFYFLTFTCKCDMGTKLKSRRVFYPRYTLSNITAMSRMNAKTFNEPLQIKLTGMVSFCNTCQQDVTIDYLFVPLSTFFLYFPIGGYEKFDVATIPTKFIAHELYLDSIAEFELGYISLSTKTAIGGVRHHLSFMYFNEKFYFYDDMSQGDVILAQNPNQIYESKDLELSALVYFRM